MDRVGEMTFFPMPKGRPSYWRCETHMPDEAFPLEIRFEVRADEEPGSLHLACLEAIRKLQIDLPAMSLGMINERLVAADHAAVEDIDDLSIRSITIPGHPVQNPWTVVFRNRRNASILIGVVFNKMLPASVWIDEIGDS